MMTAAESFDERAVLQRILERRELEQELGITTRDATDFANERCRVCGKRVSVHDELDPAYVCTKCGGRRKQAEMVRSGLLQAERPALSVPLAPEPTLPSAPPQAAPISSTSEEGPMSKEAKLCSRPGCGRKLRSHNSKGVCADRKVCVGGPLRSVPDAPPPEPKKAARPAPRRAPKTDAEETLRRFRLLAEALGLEPNEVLATFAQVWLDNARAAVLDQEDEGDAGDGDESSEDAA